MAKEKYGFVYIWRDRKHNRYYVGCHWGSTDDGYVCSSPWMRQAYKHRPQDFRRRILVNNIVIRKEMYIQEQRFFDMIKPEERKVRYYNLNLKNAKPWHSYDDSAAKTVGQKISAAKKGKSTGPCSEEKKLKISKANSGKTRSDEMKKTQSERQTGVKLSEEHRAKVIATLNPRNCLGTKLSEEHKAAISAKLKGVKKARVGSSDKQLESVRKNGNLAAEANRGSKVYNNGFVQKRIKGEPPAGWVRGGLPWKHKSVEIS